MTTPTAVTTTALAVKGERLVHVLRDAFTYEDTFIWELAQNARRSGSASVVIDFNVQERSFSIEDTGCGISDFNALLTIGQSAWDEETITADGAFGIGLLSAVHACQHLRIESQTGTIEASKEKLLSMSSIDVMPACRDKGTKVLMSQVKLERIDYIHERLRKRFAFFPIPVYMNGEQVSQPYSIDSLRADSSYIETVTDLGLVFSKPGLLVGKVSYALQGFCLHIDEGRKHRLPSDLQGDVIVHVTDPQVRARCPDRDQFLGLEMVKLRFKKTANDLDGVVLDGLAAALKFDKLYQVIDRLSDLDRLTVLNESPFLPVSYLVALDSDHVRQYGTSNWERDASDRVAPLLRSEVENGTVRLMTSSDLLDSIDDEYQHKPRLRAAAYLLAKSVTLLDSSVLDLDEGHWARASASEFSMRDEEGNEVVRILEVKEAKRGMLPLNGGGYDHLALVDSVSMDGPMGWANIEDGLVPLADDVTMGCLQVRPAAFQMCNFLFDERWDDGDEQDLDDELARFVAALEAGDAATLIRNILAERSASLRSLGEGTYEVVVSSQGVEVRLCKPKSKRSVKKK